MPVPNVQLVPVVAEHLDAFETSFDSLEANGPHQWFGHTPGLRLRTLWRENGLLNSDHNMLSVVTDDSLAGRVEWFRRAWGRPATSSCWEIAIGLFPACQGRGVGTRAQQLLVRYLFDHSRVERIQLTTDPENKAEIGAAVAAGFTLEGVVRRAQWRSGSWHDQLLYSVLRDD